MSRNGSRLGRAVATLLATAAAAAAAAGAGVDLGPDTCLNGWVWRGAIATDHVCVSSAVRAQTAQDNAFAASRVDPHGAWGPDSCVQGYVWRGAYPGDHVCVASAVRQQAQLDNANAASRRDDVRMAVRDWQPNPVQCDASGNCTTTNDTAARYRVVADRLNVGPARVILVGVDAQGGRTLIWSRIVTVPPNPAAPGGYLSFRTDELDCGGAADAYFRVQDLFSGRWSPRRDVSVGCKTL